MNTYEKKAEFCQDKMVSKNLEKIIQVKSKSRLNEVVEKTSRHLLVRRFSEFCKRTDLHGFKYMVMEELNGFERATWTVAVILSIFFAGYFVITAYNWYARNPIVTVIESTQGAIWDVPFPSVTICDLNLVSKKAAQAFANEITYPKNSNLTSQEVFRTLQLAPVLYSKYNVNRTQLRSLHKLQEVLDFNNISVDTLFNRLSPSTTCDQLIHRCMWKNTVYHCDQIFHRIFIEASFCCTFNYFATKLLKNIPPSPRRVASCGSQTALNVLINNDLANYYSTPVASQGVLIFVDNAYNHPTYESPIRVVNPFTEVRIALSPERTYANPGLKTFTPKNRHCYYGNEMKLSTFEKYTFHNCVAYKKVEMIINSCDCVPLHFPTSENHRPCNFYDMTCLDGVTRPVQDNKERAKDSSKVQCLPECEHFDYPLEVALGKLSQNGKRFTGLPFFDDVNLQNKSLLSIFFNDLVSTRYRRDVYLNWQNILATFGGLLSLMLGFTLISGFDLLIFCTFRPAYDAMTYLFKQKQVNNIDNRINPKKEYSYKTNNLMEKPSFNLSRSLTDRPYLNRY